MDQILQVIESMPRNIQTVLGKKLYLKNITNCSAEQRHWKQYHLCDFCIADDGMVPLIGKAQTLMVTVSTQLHQLQ